MKTYKNLYSQIISFDNLLLAFRKARKGKTKKEYVQSFEQKLGNKLLQLEGELETKTYKPRPLKTFVIRDPKTRKISKSDFRDRVIHHAICNIIEPIFDKTFIQDSYANRIGKGNLKAVQRFQQFMKKLPNGYCLKADIKRYFWEIDHEILMKTIRKKIADEATLWLIGQILTCSGGRKECLSEISHHNSSLIFI